MPVDKCPICGGQVEERLEDFCYAYSGTPITLTEIPHQVCANCGEALVDSRYGRLIEESIDQYRLAKQHDDNDLLTGEEVANLLAVSYQVILAMLSEGKLPGTKVGREWRVHYGLLMEYIQSMCANNLSAPEKEIHLAYAHRREKRS